MTPDRLDHAMVARGLVRSRSRARRLILDGHVTVDGEVATRPSQRTSPRQRIAVGADVRRWVGRGAEKLAGALKAFDIDVVGRIALDVGASTGGFTQVLLDSGVAEVFAVDVGHGQLAPEIRADPRVRSIEHVNARNLDRTLIPRAPSLVVVDVSFISLTLVLAPILDVCDLRADAVLLVKPQFEVGPEHLDGRAVVRSAKARAEAIASVVGAAEALGWTPLGAVRSPIFGGQGNHEYFVHLARGADTVARGLSALTAVVGEDERIPPDVEGARR